MRLGGVELGGHFASQSKPLAYFDSLSLLLSQLLRRNAGVALVGYGRGALASGLLRGEGLHRVEVGNVAQRILINVVRSCGEF